jgi:hypothetical protein
MTPEFCARWERMSRGTACVSLGLSSKYMTGHGLLPKPLEAALRRVVVSSNSEWYLVPVAAFALMPLPFVIQYRLKARKLSICPSQGIYVPASRPSLNKIPFQLVQLFANHKTSSHVDRTLNAKRKAN